MSEEDTNNFKSSGTLNEDITMHPSHEEVSEIADAQMSQANPEEVKLLSLEEQKKLFSRVKDSMLRSSTSVEAIQEVAGIVNILSAQIVAKASPLSDEQTKFFYGEFFKEICQRAANAETTNGATQEAIAELMRSLVDLLAVELKAQTPTCLDFADKMRYIFDCASRFHKNAFQSISGTTGQAQSATSDGKEAVVDLTVDEREWRKAFQVGQTVDAVKRDLKIKSEMWAKGTITHIVSAVDPLARRLTIKWLDDVSVIDGNYLASSPQIAPYNTKSGVQNWRDQIKVGDLVDAYDKYNTWSTGTVVWTDTRKQEDPPPEISMTMCKVGFRQYCPDGDKSDCMGKYSGFSDNLDEFFGVQSLKIQRPYTQTTLKDLSGNSVQMDEAMIAKLQASQGTYISDIERQAKQDSKDMEMVTQEGQLIIAVERDVCKSQLLVELLARFGDAQGFESLLGILAKQTTSLQTLHDLLTLVCGSAALYHKTFVDSFIVKLKDVAEAKLLSADESQLRPITFSKIEETVDMIWLTLMRRLVKQTEIQIGKYQLLTKLGILFFKQNFMHKRIDGAIAINQVCNQALLQANTVNLDTKKDDQITNVLPTLVKTLQEADIIDLYFSRTNIHDQLVMRAEGVLGLFLNQEALTEQQLNMIWRNCSAEDAIYRNLIASLSNLSSKVKPTQMMTIIDRIVQTPKPKVKTDEIELVLTLCYNKENSANMEDEPIVNVNRCKVLEFYWDFLTGDEADGYLNKTIANKAIFNFMDLLKASSEDLIQAYFEKVVEGLRRGKSTFLILKIAHRFFKERQITAKEALPIFADQLVKKFNFMQLIIEEMHAYSAMVNAKITEEIKELEAQGKQLDETKLHEIVYQSVFSHEEQITERISFLTIFTDQSTTKLSKQQLAQLWTALVDQSMVKFDKKQLFSMLKNFISVAMSAEKNQVISMEDLCCFYRENIASGLSDFTSLEHEGFVCIQGFFLLINSDAGRLKILDDKIGQSATTDKPQKGILKNGNKVTSISSNEGAKKQNLDFVVKTTQIDTTGTQTQGESGNSAITGGADFIGPKLPGTTTNTTSLSKLKEDNFNIITMTAPTEMEGLAGLWRIATQAENGKVRDAVISLLIQVHTSLDDKLLEKLSEFEDLYINRCIDCIHEEQAHIERRTPEEKLEASKAVTLTDKKRLLVHEKYIGNAILCLTRLIQNSEREGTFNLTSHRSFAQELPLKNIQVTNCFNYEANTGFQKTFTINLMLNMNIYQVKKIICKELAFRKVEGVQDVPYHPSSIKLVVNRYLDRPIKDFENGMLLKELFFKDTDRFTVYPRGNEDLRSQPLYDSQTKSVTDSTKVAIWTLFDKFAIDDENTPGLRYLGDAQIKSLIEKVSDKAENKPSALMAYNTREDLSKLYFDDFLNYYTQQTLEKPDMVRANLLYTGFRSDMRYIPKAGDREHKLIQHKTPQQMPRYKIANVARTFQTLLACLDLHTDTRRDANELIIQACTNERILNDVLQVNQSQFYWDNVAEKDGAKEIVYTLSLVEQILYNSNEANSSDANLDDAQAAQQTELKNTWVPRFLKSGGLNKLTQMMEKVLTELVAGRQTGEMSIEQVLKLKEIFSVTMKIVKVFVTATVCSIKNDVNADLFSIKQSPSALSKRLQQGNILAIVSKKFLRRADKEEEDLEERLDEGCISRSAAVSFFGVPLKLNNKVTKSGSTAQQQNQGSATKSTKDKETFQPEDITEELIFGPDITYGGDSIPQEVQKVKEPEQSEQPSLTKQISKEQKPNEKERIHFFEVTARYKQIATQITEAMNDSAFELNLDFERLEDFCMEAACTFMFSNDKDLTFERALIREAFDVWVACVIKSGKPLSWERKLENISEKTQVRNMSDFIREAITCQMPEVRRFWLQTLSLACEQLSQGHNREPYQLVIHELVNHLDTVTIDVRGRLSEELYELLGDCCLFQYYIERDLKNSGTQVAAVQHTYKDIMCSLVGALKEHNSFGDDVEILQRSKALESLLLSLADVFSFFNKGETYENVLKMLAEAQLVEYIFYEVLFFVPGKTQCAHRNKAKRQETRKAAYQLLFKLLKFFRPADMVAFIKNLFQPMIESVPRPRDWSHQPSDKIRRADEQVGIRNLGNVCYMISMLQQFFMVPTFRYSLLKVLDTSPEQLVEYKDRMIDDNMLRQLQILFGYLEMTERAFVDPTEFCFSFKQQNGQPTNIGEQRDAQEFLNEFFDRLENKLKGTSQRYLLADTFQGSIVSQRTCEGCNHVTRRIDPFNTQTLYVKDRADIYESLANQLEGEVVQDYKCVACNQSVNLRMSQLLGKLPNVLVLHLQRIVFDFNTFQNKKLNNRFEFPNILELSKFSCKKNIVLTEEEKKNPENQALKEMLEYDDDEFVYRLVGVNIHRGAAGAGHYWSLIHTNRGVKEPNPQTEEARWADLSNSWREFNDETVSFFLAKNIVEQGYGGYLNDQEMKIYSSGAHDDYGKSAYMLIYEKKLKSELRQIELQEGGIEVETKVPFNKINREIPSWLEEIVSKDNRAHVADNQVFHPLFFNFASLLLKHCTAELLDQEDDYGPDQKATFADLQKQIIVSSHKLSFDLLTHFTQIDSIKSVCASLRSVFSWSDPVSEFGTKEGDSLLLNFIKDALHKDKCEYFFKIMYDSTALKDVRIQIGRTVARVLVKAIKIIGVCKEDPKRKELPLVAELATLVDDVVGQIFAIIHTRTFQSKWSRLDEYFEMLAEIGTDDKYHAGFLLEKFDVVTNLCDFMLQQKSPKATTEEDPRVEMGGSASKPGFGPLVTLASQFVRCMWTQQSTEDCPTFAKKPEKEKNIEPKNLMDKRIYIGETAFEYFTNSNLFQQIMSCDFNVLDYARAIAHLCWANQKLSKKICKLAVKCRYDGSKPNYLIVMRQLLKLQDRDAQTGELLQLKRLEWLFGSPQPRHSTSDSGVTSLGLVTLNFSLHADAYSYVTSLTSKVEDSVSVLNILLKSYQVEQMAANHKSSIKPGQSIKKGKSMEDSPCKLEIKPVPITNSNIEQSSVADQLRAQGMPEEMVLKMVEAAGEAASLNEQQRPRSADGRKSKNAQKAVISVDQYLNLESLEIFVRIITSDEVCMDFFSKIPGFAYQYARYTDWIDQFLNELTLIEEKDAKALTKEQSSALKSIKNTYQRYQTFLTTFEKASTRHDNDSDIQMIDTEVPELIRPTPLPYMILKSEKETNDAGITLDSSGVFLTAQAIKCTFVVSQPTSRTNLAVSQQFLHRFGPTKTGAEASTEPSNIENLSDQAQHGDTQVQEQGAAAIKTLYSEPATMEDLKIDLEDPAVQHALEKMMHQEEFQWIFEFPEDDKIQCLQNMVKDSVFKYVKEYYELNPAKVVAAPEAVSEKKPMKEDMPDEKKSEKKVDDPFSVWEGAELQTCDDLVYELSLTNTTDQVMKYRIMFVEGSTDVLCNLVWPRNGLVGTISAEETNKLVALLPKREATPTNSGITELQKLVVMLAASNHKKKVDKDGANGGAANQGGNGGKNVSKRGESIGGDALMLNVTEKQCEACTSFNSLDATECYICQTKFQN